MKVIEGWIVRHSGINDDVLINGWLNGGIAIACVVVKFHNFVIQDNHGNSYKLGIPTWTTQLRELRKALRTRKKKWAVRSKRPLEKYPVGSSWKLISRVDYPTCQYIGTTWRLVKRNGEYCLTNIPSGFPKAPNQTWHNWHSLGDIKKIFGASSNKWEKVKEPIDLYPVGSMWKLKSTREKTSYMDGLIGTVWRIAEKDGKYCLTRTDGFPKSGQTWNYFSPIGDIKKIFGCSDYKWERVEEDKYPIGSKWRMKSVTSSAYSQYLGKTYTLLEHEGKACLTRHPGESNFNNAHTWNGFYNDTKKPFTSNIHVTWERIP